MRDRDLVHAAYLRGKNDIREGVVLSDEAIDNAVGEEYSKDYKRALADHEHLKKILGVGRWTRTS